MESKLDAMFNQWLKVRVSFKTEAEALKAVEDDGDALQYVQDQTEAICLRAVESDGYALQYVQDQLFEHLLNSAPKRIITKAEIAEKFGVSDFEISE